MENKDLILSVKDLQISFKTDHGILKAVRNISFDLNRGETLCIVGESGSGKSVTSKAIMGILAANAIVENGSIMYNGENLLEVSEDEFHRIRGHKIGMIFQDPLSSLNPIVKIGKQITEAMLVNSNKLKTMYKDIVAPDLIAYKNLIERKNIKIRNNKEKMKKNVSILKAQLKEASADEKVNINKNINELKTHHAKFVSELKEEVRTKLPTLKSNLSNKKVEAKAAVKEFKKQAIIERNNKIAKLNADYKDRESHILGLSDKTEAQKQLAELKDKYNK
jgi:oligopeptide transport system ATP-binding protein